MKIHSHQECYIKKVFLKISQNSQENIRARVSYLIKLQTEVCNFVENVTLTQVFCCKFCEIFKNNFLENTYRRLLLVYVSH